ncbi:MAG: sulfatase, partial [Planctomycetota bacterium]
LSVANAARGKVQLVVLTEAGEEIVATADLPKGRAKHGATVKLARNVRADETVTSLTMSFDINRPLTIHGIEFARQSLLATLPSPETGPALVSVGQEARRAYGLASGQVFEAQVRVQPEDVIRFSAALLTPESASAMPKLVVTLNGGEQSTSVPVKKRWGGGAVVWDEAASLSLRIEVVDAAPGAVFALGEPTVLSGGAAGSTDPVAASGLAVTLVTSSTHRADHLGQTFGAEQGALDTPSLDGLADEGVLFESAWATSNAAIPSHAALLTGRHPRDTKVLGNDAGLGADPEFGPTTLAEAFAEAGYYTVAVLSSPHLAHASSGLGRGFDRVICPEASEARAASSVRAALEALNHEGPIFVWVHLFDAHGPYAPPAEFDRRYYPQGVDPFDPALPEIDLAGGRMPEWLRGLRDTEYPRAQYRAEIAYLDSVLGEWLDHPRVKAGVTAFTSDHGEVFERRGGSFEHRGLTPETLRVPLIVRAPGFRDAGERVGAQVRQLDVARTILNLAGLSGVEFPGDDLALAGEGGAGAKASFALSRRFASMTEGRWHAILTLQDLSNAKDGRWPARHQLELFDVEADAGCAHDVAGAEVERATRMRRELVEWMASADPMLRASRPNLDLAAKEYLGGLGYGGESIPPPGPFDAACTCNECLKLR